MGKRLGSDVLDGWPAPEHTHTLSQYHSTIDSSVMDIIQGSLITARQKIKIKTYDCVA